MSLLRIRLARAKDADAMADLLNVIILVGGSTAHQRMFDAERMLQHYLAPDDNLCCHVAEIDGTLAGFQSLVWANDPGDPMPPGWTIVATFVAPAFHGRRLGQTLFSATRGEALDAGAKTIDATIRADNPAGLRYYSGLGFKDYDILKAVPLRDGTPVDRVRKRFDL